MKPELPLRDIHLPPEPSWWPPAPGWWLLAVLLLALITTGSVLLRRRLGRQRRRRALLAEVDRIWELHASNDSGADIISGWSTLLRRACLRYRPELVTLEGRAWPLALGIGEQSDPELAMLLVEAPFRPAVPRAQAEALREPVREALRRLCDGEHDSDIAARDARDD